MTGDWQPAAGFLERAFLREGVTRQGRPLWALADLDPHRWNIGRGDSSRPQYSELRKHFVVNLSDQIILAVGFAAPHLPELDGIDCHGILPDSSWITPRLPGPARRVNSQRGYRGPVRTLAVVLSVNGRSVNQPLC